MKIALNFATTIFTVGISAFTINANANEAALLRCRALTENTARLACYDGIAIAPAGPAAAGASANQTAAITTPEQFGLQLKSHPGEINSIESAIDGSLDGWQANSRIKLANGQVWQVSDDSSAFCNCNNKKAVVRRGALGSFFLEIEGTNRSPKVKRIK
jgi:hypothetical protein